MVMKLVFREHIFTKANTNPNQAKLTARLLLRTVNEEIKLKNPCSQTVLPSGPAAGRQTIQYRQNTPLKNTK
jgi:hypothetical protein